MKIPDIFVPEKNFENNIEKLLNDKKPLVQPVYSKLEVIHAGTYAKGIVEIKKRGRKPFNFSENISARIANYEANGEDVDLFNTYLVSVTGIAYKMRSTKFKLILRSDKLENIKSDFNKSFISVDYNAENGIEFDSKKGKYNQPLTREKTKNHEFWLAAMNGDKETLVEYVDIWFGKTEAKGGMGVYLRNNTSQDELRALVLDGGGGHYLSSAGGDSELDGSACFLLSTQ